MTDLTTLAYARDLDRQDELAAFRSHFVATDPDLIYLDGNSLGRLPKRPSPCSTMWSTASGVTA